MSDVYSFNPQERDSIVNRFGPSFLEKVGLDLTRCADQWALSDVRLIPSYSANLVFTCESERFGSAVIKISPPGSDGIANEYRTLAAYDGWRFCRALAADLERGVLLEQRIRPGTPLRDESSLDKRLAVFCSLYEGLHQQPADVRQLPTYTEWVEKITAYMSKRLDCSALYAHMARAKEICLAVASQYRKRMLLHGDLHHDNMLLNEGGTYTIIDPKGVIGDPVFDVPRFILNEFEDELSPELFEKLLKTVRVLAERLQIPEPIVKQCLYVETAMGVCWSVEDGATAEEYGKLLANVEFAESVMNA